MLVVVRGDIAYTKTEVIGLDVLASGHPSLYSLIVGKLGYGLDSDGNVANERSGRRDESCQPDAGGRLICLKPFMYPTDVINVLHETGGFSVASSACQGNNVHVWTLAK